MLKSNFNLNPSFPFHSAIRHPKSSSVQESKTEPNIIKPIVQIKSKKLCVKKQQQIKKLEEITQKYKERQNQNKGSKVENKSNTLTNNDKERKEKSLIPVIKKNDTNTSEEAIISSRQIKSFVKPPKNGTDKKTKDSNSNLHKLQTSKNNFNSVGTNTELLCPCVPCIIHDNIKENAKSENKKYVESNILEVATIYKGNDVSETKLELLYKNPTISNSRDNDDVIKTIIENNTENIDSTNSSGAFSVITTNKSEELVIDAFCNSNYTSNSVLDEIKDNLSTEMLDADCENGDCQENFDDSLNEKYFDSNTYTKYTNDASEIEEFMNLTDKLLNEQNLNGSKANTENNMCIDLHTPNTDSLEVTDNDNLDNENPNGQSGYKFSDTLAEVKNNLHQLLRNSTNASACKTDDISCEILNESINSKKLVSNMEHITIYEIEDEVAQDEILKLPSITETNKPITKVTNVSKRVQGLYKGNKKYKMLCDHKKDDIVFQTFTVNENNDEQLEAPPMKLPRIENKRLYCRL